MQFSSSDVESSTVAAGLEHPASLTDLSLRPAGGHGSPAPGQREHARAKAMLRRYLSSPLNTTGTHELTRRRRSRMTPKARMRVTWNDDDDRRALLWPESMVGRCVGARGG